MSWLALPMSPPESSSALLHSMMPAPVCSRSSCMSSVALGMVLCVLVFVEIVVLHHEVLFGHHGQVRRHLLDLFVFESALRQHVAHDGGTCLAAFNDGIGNLAGDQPHGAD